MLGGGVGYAFANGLRVEFEFAHRNHDLKEVVFTDNGFAVDASGDLRVNSGMVNAIYDFRTGTALTPYLGAGIGIAWTDMNVIRPPRVLDVNNTAFAYQLIAGLSLKVSPNVDIFGQYQYFSVPGFELGGDMVGVRTGLSPDRIDRVDA